MFESGMFFSKQFSSKGLVIPMLYFDAEQLLHLDHRFRTSFINGLSSFRPVVLVGSSDKEGRTNLSIFNSMIHIGANPPLIGLLFRPHTVERHTFENILRTKEYTINAVAEKDLAMAHQTSARYPKEISEFDACGFTTAYFDNFLAPFVAHAPISLGLELTEQHEIKSNGTILVIGAIKHLSISESILQNDGHLRQDKADLICCGGLDTYFKPQFIERLPYAKVAKTY
jgi:flavin reductase (DIM6/NTAB) family NADH-FMN oxidoreductase RutF